ncbi:MAG: 16S rRNA (cytidine(1402)-2'-O)-methyltransferase [Bacteroidales bacterium]
MATLYLIPTPIGNLEDITLRAIRILKEVDLILCEDTRTSKPLLKHFEISTPLLSYHIFNEHQKIESIIDRMKMGENIGLISDAGTPGISDPGFLLVREAVKNGIEVDTLPGATAFVPALVNSALPMDRFCFEGFLPHKKGRQTRLEKLKEEERTIVLYESPHRLIKTLTQLSEYLGSDRQASVSREISKMFQENKRGSLESLIEYFSSKTIKGEIVICVEGNK